MALVFLGALLDAPGATARAALLPDVVELAGVRMERASGIRGGDPAEAQLLVGAPIGGVLVATFGATDALWLDAASFLVSAALVAGVRAAARHAAGEAEEPSRFFAELAEGMRFIWDQRSCSRALVLTVLAARTSSRHRSPWSWPCSPRRSTAAPPTSGSCSASSAAARSPARSSYSAIGHRLPRRRTFLVLLRRRSLMLPRAGDPAVAAGRARRARVRRARRRPDQPAHLHRRRPSSSRRTSAGASSAPSARARGRRFPRDPARRRPRRGDRGRRDVPRDRRRSPLSSATGSSTRVPGDGQ